MVNDNHPFIVQLKTFNYEGLEFSFFDRISGFLTAQVEPQDSWFREKGG